jgi:hypothetical protein
MPASLLDLVEALFELWDLLVNWRFWLPVLGAVAIAILIAETVDDATLRWVLTIPVLAAGLFGGILWHRKE